MFSNIRKPFRMMSLLLVLSLNPVALLATNPAPSAGNEPSQEGVPVPTLAPVELTDEAKEELRALAERERAERIRVNPTSVCDEKTTPFQKDCCLRVERLKKLQAQEFDLTDEEGKTLFTLQQEHDEALAELTLIEGVEKLQEDYLGFMGRLMNPEKNENHPLKNMDALERDIHQGMDTVYRMKYLHEVMDILKNEVGFDHSTELSKDNGDVIYEKILAHCDGKQEGVCQLVNSNNINENKSLPRRERYGKTDFKDMLASYLDSYNIATQAKTPAEKSALHGKLSLQIQKIPRSLISQQISDYQSTMKNIQNRFNPKSEGPHADAVREAYRCAELVRYGKKDGSIGCSQLDSKVTNFILEVNRDLMNGQNSLLESITNLPPGLKSHLKELAIDGSLENYTSNVGNTTGQASIHVKNMQKDIENRLKIASSLTQKRPEQREDFFKKLDQTTDEDNKFIFMQKLCGVKQLEPSFGSEGFHQCLDGITQVDLNQTKAKKAELKNAVDKLKGKVEKVTDSSAYKNLNSFKNYLADQAHFQCKPQQDSEEGLSIQGCLVDVDENVTLSKLVDFAGAVVAEVNFSESGKEFTTEKIIEMFSFCNAQASDEQKEEFKNECEYISKQYRLINEKMDRIDPEFKEWSRSNMNVYDPKTDSVTSVKRRGTWSMVGLGTLGAIGSSIPTFMQYQQTKFSLPFMRDQAIARKQMNFWNGQYFNASFMRPGFNPFGMGTGFGGYQVGALNFPGQGGFRAPLTPQNISIP